MVQVDDYYNSTHLSAYSTQIKKVLADGSSAPGYYFGRFASGELKGTMQKIHIQVGQIAKPSANGSNTRWLTYCGVPMEHWPMMLDNVVNYCPVEE